MICIFCLDWSKGEMFLNTFWKEDECLASDMFGLHYCVEFATTGMLIQWLLCTWRARDVLAMECAVHKSI